MKPHPNTHRPRDAQVILRQKSVDLASVKTRFDEKKDHEIFGPHMQMPSYTPLNFQTQEDENDESITYSFVHPCEPYIEEHNPNLSVKLIVSAIIEMVLSKQRKKSFASETGANLRQVIVQQKVKVIVKNFIKKLTRNNINSKPIDFTPFFNDTELSFLDTEGIELNDFLEIILSICSIFLIVAFSILSTLSLVFRDIEGSLTFNACESICLIYFSFQALINMITVKFQEGKRLGTLRKILEYYIRHTLFTDLLTIILLFVDQFIDSSHTELTYLRILIILKWGQLFQKVEKLQIFFIRNFYYEQYWDLMKVFLFNLSLAHILAICLTGMASINIQNSWMDGKNLTLAPWYEKYTWAYYWATNIMLTVGFGDLTATNYQEAIVVTLIQTVSCIALAYNINRVGVLINNIRAKDLEKGKNFKIFYSLSRKNDLSEDLEWRINNYIEESSNIKKQFNHEEENQFVEKLPQGLKTEYLKESNNKIFKNLPFFMHLTQRTVFAFAQKIEMHICHPEEIIQHLDDPHNLLILKGGEIGFTCKRSGCKFNSTVVDQLKTLNIANPILVSLGFIKNPRMNYEIKSLAYSVLYFLDNESIISILKNSQMDYELFCLLKDKSQIMPDEFQLLECEICKQKHTKFNCPKLHYIPFRQHITNRYIFKVKCDRNRRIFSGRYPKLILKALQLYRNNFQTEIQDPLQVKSEKFFESSLQNKTKSNTFEVKVDTGFVKRRFQDVDEGTNSLVKEISDIKDFFSKNTVELIKYEMTKAMGIGQSLDEVWIIESDKMKNYKNYFENDNSCNLVDKFNAPRRCNVSFLSGSSSLRKSGKNNMKDTRRTGSRNEQTRVSRRVL